MLTSVVLACHRPGTHSLSGTTLFFCFLAPLGAAHKNTRHTRQLVDTLVLYTELTQVTHRCGANDEVGPKPTAFGRAPSSTRLRAHNTSMDKTEHSTTLRLAKPPLPVGQRSPQDQAGVWRVWEGGANGDTPIACCTNTRQCCYTLTPKDAGQERLSKWQQFSKTPTSSSKSSPTSKLDNQHTEPLVLCRPDRDVCLHAVQHSPQGLATDTGRHQSSSSTPAHTRANAVLFLQEFSYVYEYGHAHSQHTHISQHNYNTTPQASMCRRQGPPGLG